MIILQSVRHARRWAVGAMALSLLSVPSAQALTIQEMLTAAVNQPAVAVSDLAAHEGNLRKEAATAALLPRINAFGKTEFYNSPTNLRPIPPTEVNILAGDSIPFCIIIKNSVLLIDFYQHHRERGESPFDSAVESVRVLFRPVLMTAFGTIAGMIPIAFEWAVGLERLSPLADVATGGRLIGTILTLVYIPMLAYSVDKRTHSAPSQDTEPSRS